jgi:predicted O-linked N-acetylglucosamine transferase (SPINDLY family)
MLLRLIRQLIAPHRKQGDAARSQAIGLQAAGPDEGLRECERLERAGDLASALECYRSYSAAHPSNLDAKAAIANTLASMWRMEECIAACLDALAAAPANTELFSALLLYSHYAAKPDPQELFERHLRYGELLGRTIAPIYRARRRNAPDPERRLRVGYVSRNLSRHSVGYFVEPMIEHHDRTRFDVYCYYTHALADDVTERFARAASVWRHLPDVDPDALAARIEEDGIDVLVDLGGHTKLNRLTAFAREPAPVQLTWLGYPDTTGVRSIAYRITDEIADPPGRADELHSEKLLRLAPPFICYRPAPDSPPVSAREAAAEVVFGSFNILAKVNDPLIELWCCVLAAVPRSRLVLKSAALGNEAAADRLLGRFAAHGVESDRIELHGWSTDRTGHLGAYAGIDIALDTFPYNGTTTTCEALWMGVPVITLEGDVHMARVGASLLAAAGLEALVARTPEEYVHAAVTLATDAARRERTREGMREQLLASPLLDHAGYTRKLEAAYRDAWRAWCRSRTHEAISI